MVAEHQPLSDPKDNFQKLLLKCIINEEEEIDLFTQDLERLKEMREKIAQE